MTIFDYYNYKEFVRDWVKSQPNGGHGVYRKIADTLSIAPVTVSQIFNGNRELALESVIPLATIIRLNDFEQKYFMLLVLKSRSGSFELTHFLEKEIQTIKYEADLIKNITPTDISLSEPELAKFNSSWVYSAVRQLTALKEYQTIPKLSERLRFSQEYISKILEFLVSSGLCKFEEGLFTPTVRHTHTPDDSPYLTQRQSSWRLKAIDNMPNKKHDELFYTSCITISREDIPKVKRELLNAISAIRKIIDISESEEALCINIDYFKF